MNSPSSTQSLIRRVILRTSNAARLATFYQELLGLLPQPDPADPRILELIHPLTGTALITLLDDPAARPAPPSAPGLFHLALLFPELDDWRAAVNRALALTAGRCGASDHGVSWAVYLSDPDDNGIELAWDKPADEWPWHGDQIRMVTRSLPLRAITLEGATRHRPAGAFSIGHLHLQVADLAVAASYQAALGLRVTQADYPGALFLARGHYHHHLAINTWRTDPRVSRPDGAIGLAGWEMTRPVGTHSASWQDPGGYQITLVAE